MNSGRWNAAGSEESRFSCRLPPMLNRSPLAAWIVNENWLPLTITIRETVRDVKFRQEHAGHVEHMALVGERIAAIAVAVRRIRHVQVELSMLFCSGASSMAWDQVYVANVGLLRAHRFSGVSSGRCRSTGRRTRPSGCCRNPDTLSRTWRRSGVHPPVKHRTGPVEVRYTGRWVPLVYR